jgi:hypothetical protein
MGQLARMQLSPSPKLKRIHDQRIIYENEVKAKHVDSPKGPLLRLQQFLLEPSIKFGVC